MVNAALSAEILVTSHLAQNPGNASVKLKSQPDFYSDVASASKVLCGSTDGHNVLEEEPDKMYACISQRNW